MNAAIVAQYIGSAANQVVRFEEWAHVYFIQVEGFRPRFVSKKAVAEWKTLRGSYGQYSRKYFDKNQDACPLHKSPTAKKAMAAREARWAAMAPVPATHPGARFLPSSFVA